MKKYVILFMAISALLTSNLSHSMRQPYQPGSYGMQGVRGSSGPLYPAEVVGSRGPSYPAEVFGSRGPIVSVGTTSPIGIQRGILEFYNTLQEPVSYDYSTILNGVDSATGITLSNSRTSNRGIVPVNQPHIVSTSSDFNFGDNSSGDIWGSTISVNLKRPNDARSKNFVLQQLGRYLITLDPQGEIDLVYVS